MILSKIVAAKIKCLVEQKKNASLEELKAKIKDRPARLPGCFAAALTANSSSAPAINPGKGIALIAEVKRASPSKGMIAPDFNYLQVASNYEQFGAGAISVLTEEDYFLGSPVYLQEIREQVQIPLLRKDFIIDPYQIYESILLGADAILLIVSLLKDSELKEFLKIADSIGLDCLVEAHDQIEVERALAASAKVIGINNRDLQIFTVDLENSRKLGEMIPDRIIKVSESGINSAADIQSVYDWGFDAVLIGEALMKADNLQQKFAEFSKLGTEVPE